MLFISGEIPPEKIYILLFGLGCFHFR